MISVRIGGLLVAIGMVAILIVPSPYWVICQAVGVLLVCLGLGDHFGDQAAWAEARVLEEFVPHGISREETVAAMANSPRVRTDHWVSEMNWPPAMAGAEETLYYHDARSAARVEIIDGIVVRVKAYPKSYLRLVT